MSRPGPPAPNLLDRLGVVLVGLVGVLSGLLECLLVPVYVGSTPVPLAVLLAVIGNAVLPRIARAFVPTAAAAVVPLVGWLLVVVVFGVVTRPEGDVILPGGDLSWITYALVLVGAAAGTISIVTSTPLPARAPLNR